MRGIDCLPFKFSDGSRWFSQGLDLLNGPDSSLSFALDRGQGWLRRQLGEKAAQLGRGFELRDRIELLERAGEGIGQAPHGPRRELRIFGLKVQPVDFRQKTPWSVEGAVDERIVEDQLCALVADLRLPPQLHLELQWLNVSLNPVNADSKRVDQVEAFGVF